MLPSLFVLQLLVLIRPSVARLPPLQPSSEDSLRTVTAVILFVDSQVPGLLSRERLTGIANDEATAARVRLVLFDLATALHLPDTLLVLKVQLGPTREDYSIEAEWLVPPALFRRGTRYADAPLRLACMRGIAGSVTHPLGMSDEAVRQRVEAPWRRVLQEALACLTHET